MRLFDTRIQKTKYKVLREIIRRAYDDNLTENMYLEIPKKLVPGPKAEMRCCIYKERAVLQERIALAIGGDKNNPNIIEVLDIACDECPVDSYFVTDACRGCITHRCMENCPVGAISVVDKRARINNETCIECGKCMKSCPYGAIIENVRPCVRSCKAGAISMDEHKKAKIDDSKCTMCGACVYMCPWGAIMDKSFVLDAVRILRESENNTKYKVYAIVAPSIVSQFKYAKIEQVVTGIQKLGFYHVVEAALGADITLHRELEEFREGCERLTTSCCPSFVMYIEKQFPQFAKYISHSPSPMIETADLIKATDPTAKCIFIGPCTSKKAEIQRPENKDRVDCVLTFEELQAFLDAREIKVEELEETFLDNASFYGRIFAKAGGIKQGVTELAAKAGITGIRPLNCNGLEEIRMALLKLKVNKLPENFIEGMACEGGCLNGAGCLTHGPKNVLDVDNYGKSAKEHDIENSVKLYESAHGKKL